MLPFEFTVPGPPRSHQTRDRRKLHAWREKVRKAAAALWTDRAAFAENLRIVVTYYHEGPAVRIDDDNLLKPIQDALIGLAYDDDRVITDAAVRKTCIDWPIQVRRLSLVLLAAFSRGEEFIHVRLEPAPDHSETLK